MIRISRPAWNAMVTHAEAAYPEECCGAMLGTIAEGRKTVREAVRLENVHPSPRAAYEARVEDLLRVVREARARDLELVGIYHSHPDAAAYFSEADLRNSWPDYSFVVLSVRGGRFDHAGSWVPDAKQTAAEEPLITYPARRRYRRC